MRVKHPIEQPHAADIDRDALRLRVLATGLVIDRCYVYAPEFIDPAARAEILIWLGTLKPLWEQRYRAGRTGLPQWARDAPDRCAVVEDSVSGVAAGLSAGMVVFAFAGGVTSAEMLSREGAVVFEDMRELPALIRAH